MLTSPSEWIPVDTAAEKLAAQSDEFSSADARHFLWRAFWQGEFDAPDGNPRDWGIIHTDDHLLVAEPTPLCRQWALIDGLALWKVLQLWDGGDTEHGRPRQPPEDIYPELYQRLTTSFTNMIDDGIGRDLNIDSISTAILARSVVRREALDAWMSRNAFSMADGLHGRLDREAESQARIVEHTKIEKRRAAKAEHDRREYERLRWEGERANIVAKLEFLLEDSRKRETKAEANGLMAQGHTREVEKLIVQNTIISAQKEAERTPAQKRVVLKKQLEDWMDNLVREKNLLNQWPEPLSKVWKDAKASLGENITRAMVDAAMTPYGKRRRGEKGNRQIKSPRI